MVKDVQLELTLPMWGGRREGAGRKLQAERTSVPHLVRPVVKSWNPLHVTLRVRDDLPDLRVRECWAAIVRTLREFRGRFALQFVHFVVLFNHLHLIAESEGRESLSSGMQAFTTRLAKAINATFDRTGTVFASRYHARELTTPREVFYALRYVLLNGRHHAQDAGLRLPAGWFDERSTAAIFDGWRDPPHVPARERGCDFGTSPARTWLLRVGWRRHGLLALDDTPGPTPRITRIIRVREDLAA
jgi:putative transposase